LKTAAFLSMLEEIIGVPPGKLRLEDGPKTIKKWDSLVHVTILASIDRTIGLELDDSMTQFQTVGELINLLKDQNALED
jgi:acyl carrier protein